MPMFTGKQTFALFCRFENTIEVIVFPAHKTRRTQNYWISRELTTMCESEHHVRIYRTFPSHGDSIPPVYPSESHQICTLWNVPAATVIPFVGQFAVLERHTVYQRWCCRRGPMMDQGVLMYLCPSTVSLEPVAGRFFRQWRRMCWKVTGFAPKKHIPWPCLCSSKVRAHIGVTWRRSDGRALVYVQSVAVLLPESRPRKAGLHESLLLAAAAS